MAHLIELGRFAALHPESNVTMSHIAIHLMLRLEDDRVIATSTAARRKITRSILRVGRPFGLVAFRAADTHVHLQALCDLRAAGQLGRRAAIALRRSLALPVRFKPCHVKPINDQAHLYRAFHYILRQDDHHDLNVDTYHEASNLPDLLGMRLVGRYTWENMRAHLPR
jgi:hypothetical protein